MPAFATTKWQMIGCVHVGKLAHVYICVCVLEYVS